MKEGERLIDGFRIFHEEGVRRRENDVCFHAFDFSAVDGYLPVVGAVDHEAVDPVYGPVSGNDAEVEFDGAELIWSGLGIGSELASSGTIEFLKEAPRVELIDDFAPLVWGAEHDDPPELIALMATVIASHKDAAEGMGNEVDLGAFFENRVNEGCPNGIFTESADIGCARGVVDVDDLEAGLFQGIGHFVHAGTASAEPVEENDAFLSPGESRRNPDHQSQEGNPVDAWRAFQKRGCIVGSTVFGDCAGRSRFRRVAFRLFCVVAREG